MKRPKVGVGVMVLKEGKVLLSRRISETEGNGTYQLPGGHLEFGETFAECAIREVAEETGLIISNARFVMVGNMFEMPHWHSIQIGMLADWEGGEPSVMEPEKSGSWLWYSLDDLPSPIFAPSGYTLEAYKNGKVFLGDRAV